MDGHPRTIPEMLHRSVEAHGDRRALVTIDERITYADLSARVDRCARSLVACGVGKGARVALLMENDPQWVVLALATTSLGAILVPVSTFSKADDLAYQLPHSDVAHLILSPAFLGYDYLSMLTGLAPELADGEPGRLICARLPALRNVVVAGADAVAGAGLPSGCHSWNTFDDLAEEVPRDLVRRLYDEVDGEDDAYLLTTSGTTARPKGVLLTHAALARNGCQIGDAQHLDPDDVAWAYFPLFFSAGCINVMLGTLSHGAALILQPNMDAGAALELIEREKATTWHLWPHQLKLLSEHPDWNERDHSHLHKGTAPYDVLLEKRPEDGLGGVNMYGMTETTTAFSCTDASEPLDVRLSTQGQLLPGNELKVVDPETGERLLEGEKGEICVKGPTVMRRYYKVDPTETFDAEGFFHTGDLGFVDTEGRVHFEQRLKDVIKTGGINVSPADIEATLSQIPDVDAVYVFDIPAGDKGQAVGAALVSEKDFDRVAITRFCRTELPGYKRPQGVLLLTADRVPMTGSGKVQKHVLRDRLLAGLAESPDDPFVEDRDA